MKIGVSTSTDPHSGYGKYWGRDTYKVLRDIGFECVDLSILCDRFGVLHSSRRGGSSAAS